MISQAPPLTQDQRLQIERELAAGERLMWSAQPRARSGLAGFAIWLFAIPWTGFALFWEAMALSGWLSGEMPKGVGGVLMGMIFPLFGLPFVLVGLAMMASPFFAWREQARSLVALTDRRVLVISGAPRRKVRSILIEQIGPITRNEGADGYGSLSIQTHTRRDSDGDRVTESFSLQGVPNVGNLERMILKALQPR